MSVTTARQSAGGGSESLISLVPTVSTSPAYTAGDNVGGLLVLPGAVRAGVGTGVLQSLTITDASHQAAALELIVFDRRPSAATITDNVAFGAASNLANVLGHVTIASGDWITIGSLSYATKTGLQLALASASGTTLYAALVTTGTPTYATTAALTLHVGIIQN